MDLDVLTVAIDHLVEAGPSSLADGESIEELRRQRADPDGADGESERRRSRRDVYLVKSFSSLWLGQMTLDPLSGSVVATELDRLERQLFEADGAEATERLGREPTVADLAPAPGRRPGGDGHPLGHRP